MALSGQLGANLGVEGVPSGVLLGDVAGGGGPPGGVLRAAALCRAGMDEDRGAGVGCCAEERQRVFRLAGCPEPGCGKADAGGALGNGLGGELGLAVALQGSWSGRPPPKLVRQLRGCFLPGGDGGEGVASREGFEADGARECDERAVDDEVAGARVGVVVARVDVEAGLGFEVDAPASLGPSGPGRSATPL